MDSHQKYVSQIENKISGATMFKSEQDKMQSLFQYDRNQLKINNGQHQDVIKQDILISSIYAEKSLQQIYNFYVNSYIQPRKHYETFDQVNIRKLTFQPFILFMKNFKLLKIIFPLDKIKLFFKKYSHYGQYLTIQNFIFLINQLSHESEAKTFFGIPQQNVDLQTEDELEKQELYYYMNLQDRNRYRLNFKNVFEPFNCQNKPQFNKIKYSYRKFSLPELRKKAIPQKQQQQEKDYYIVKNKQEIDVTPFQKAKSIIVSWETLRAKPVTGIQHDSEEVVKKKFVKNDDEDVFLGQYGGKNQQLRKKVQKQLRQMQTDDNIKNRGILAKLEQRQQKMTLKTEKSMKRLIKSPSWK